MGEYCLFTNLLNCSWPTAVCAFWLKYPNSYSKHVLSEDVLDRQITPGGQLYTRRLLTKTNSLPRWGSAIFRNMKKVVYILEESIVDVKQEKMKVYTWNTSYKTMMDVQEKITITPDEDGKTLVKKEGWIDSSFTGFRTALRKFGKSRWSENSKKAFLGYQSVVNAQLNININHFKSFENRFNSIKNVTDKAKLKALKMAAKSQVHS